MVTQMWDLSEIQIKKWINIVHKTPLYLCFLYSFHLYNLVLHKRQIVWPLFTSSLCSVCTSSANAMEKCCANEAYVVQICNSSHATMVQS